MISIFQNLPTTMMVAVVADNLSFPHIGWKINSTFNINLLFQPGMSLEIYCGFQFTVIQALETLATKSIDNSGLNSKVYFLSSNASNCFTLSSN